MPPSRAKRTATLRALMLLTPLAWPAVPAEAEDAVLAMAAGQVPVPFDFRDHCSLREEKADGVRDWCRRQPQAAWDRACDFACRTWEDQTHFYCWDNLLCLALGVAVAAPLANTHGDQNFRDWYQGRVRSSTTNGIAAEGSRWGDHFFVIPIYLGAAIVGGLFEDTMTGSIAHEWGTRTLRALVAGAPAVGILQYGLGASRPVESSSGWQPFRDNNSVAGHGFVGATPFLTAAAMTENRWLRSAFFAASFATDFARINDDAHYLSQAILGWWIAYLAVQSVETTERTAQRILFLPSGPGGGAGVSLRVDY
jgi:hypothetical protein